MEKITKAYLRKQVITIQNSIALKTKKQANDRIFERVVLDPFTRNSKCICIYLSLLTEVHTHLLIEYFFKQKKRLVAPKLVSKEKIELYEIYSMNDLSNGPFSILEPSTTKIVNPSTIDLFFIPGIAFTKRGDRLGHGRGHYDRLLINSNSPKIGLAYSWQIVPYIPHEPYDILMTEIITEQETYIVRM